MRTSPRLLIRIAVKNAIHPFRRLITWRLQLQHARFDRRAGVRTTGKVTLQELGLSPTSSHSYEATPISFFHSVLRKLSSEYRRTVFVDLGCGKGRTLLLASKYAFRRIVGIEISQALCQIANDNIKAYFAESEDSNRISVICAGIDVFEYDIFEKGDHILIYMYNPCGEPVLEGVLNKLHRLVSQGHWITILYLNPTCMGLMLAASWLREIRRGEAFDEAGNCFEPYVVFQSVTPPWKEVVEALDFRFGPWMLAEWRFDSLSNTTSPVVAGGGCLDKPPVSQPTSCQQMRDDGTISRTLSFDGRAIRYVPCRGKRHFIDLSIGSFNDYLGMFSKKTSAELKQRVRQFAKHSGGVIDLRYYALPEDMMGFCGHASAISHLADQRRRGWAFPETKEFKAHVVDEAEKGRVCGFLLMHDNMPVSYAFCRTDADVIRFALMGYDPKFARFSPATVLLSLVLERLFADLRFRQLDVGGDEWDYEILLGTSSVDYLRVIWFPVTITHLALVVAHCAVRQVRRAISSIKRATFSWARSTRAAALRHV